MNVGVREVEEARERIREHLWPTPLALHVVPGASEVHLKLECRQRTGSFKLRGALNAVAMLGADDRARGVVTASAGNHGLGVALAGKLLGVRTTIFVPADAPALKRERIARHGAELRLVRGDYDEAHRLAQRHASETEAPYIHAYSDPRVVAGQGTVALEIIEALPEVGTLLVPVGGGGLIGGMGIVARAMRPGLRVVGIQSTATPAMHASLAAGVLVSPPMAPTLCDGLHGDTDERSLALARRVVDRMELVDEAEIPRAIRRLYLEEGIVAEGSGAAAVAALHAGLLRDEPGPIVAVVTGGNIDGSRLAEILMRSE
jgi:threonine dehydratase